MFKRKIKFIKVNNSNFKHSHILEQDLLYSNYRGFDYFNILQTKENELILIYRNIQQDLILYNLSKKILNKINIDDIKFENIYDIKYYCKEENEFIFICTNVVDQKNTIYILQYVNDNLIPFKVVNNPHPFSNKIGIRILNTDKNEIIISFCDKGNINLYDKNFDIIQKINLAYWIGDLNIFEHASKYFIITSQIGKIVIYDLKEFKEYKTLKSNNAYHTNFIINKIDDDKIQIIDNYKIHINNRSDIIISI